MQIWVVLHLFGPSGGAARACRYLLLDAAGQDVPWSTAPGVLARILAARGALTEEHTTICQTVEMWLRLVRPDVYAQLPREAPAWRGCAVDLRALELRASEIRTVLANGD